MQCNVMQYNANEVYFATYLAIDVCEVSYHMKYKMTPEYINWCLKWGFYLKFSKDLEFLFLPEFES